jgi:hypothetical protein
MNDIERDDPLSRALHQLKDADHDMSASPEVEARLLREVRSLGSRRVSRGFLFGLAAAAVVIAGVSLWLWIPRVAVQEPARTVTRVTPVEPAESVTQFFPLFYSTVPAARTHLVRMELPRMALAQLGLASADAFDRTVGTVLADVVGGEDGLARAVRFVQKNSQERRQ